MRGSMGEPEIEATVLLTIATCMIGRREPCPLGLVWPSD